MNQHKFLIRFLQVIGLLYGFMFLTNMAHYSSIGLDFGFGSLTETQLRIRWPGNGSFWIGGSTVPVRSSGIYVDAAGAFWQTPQAPPHTPWQEAGFWYIHEHSAQDSQRYFVGIPSWLPLAGMLFLTVNNRNRLKREG